MNQPTIPNPNPNPNPNPSPSPSPSPTPNPVPNPNPNPAETRTRRTEPTAPGYGLFLWALATASLLPSAPDADLWGHIRFGLDKIEARSPVLPDRYSYLAEGRTWINHEWLGEVALGFAWGTAGVFGLFLLKLAVAGAVVALLARDLRRADPSALRAGAVVVLLAIPLSAGLRLLRPQMFTHLAFLILLLNIRDADRDLPGGASARTVGTFALFGLWANLHGGVWAGLLVLTAWGASRVLWAGWAWLRRGRPDLDPKALARVCAMLAAGWLGSFLNPRGWGLHWFFLTEASGARSEIVDWQPLNLSAHAVAWAYPALVASAAWGFANGTPRPRPREIALFALIALTPLLAVRNLGLFALAWAVFAGAPALAAFRAFLERRPAPEEPGPLATDDGGWMLASAGLAVLVFGLASSVLSFRNHPVRGIAVPTRAADVVLRSGVQGNVATYFDWGEYLLWHLHPAVRVSIDGRRETVYPDEIYRENLDFTRGLGDWSRLVRRPETDFVWMPRATAARNLMVEREDWEPVYEDEYCTIFARPGSTVADAIKRTKPDPSLPADGDGMRFPR